MRGLEHIVNTRLYAPSIMPVLPDSGMPQGRIIYEAPSQKSIMIFDDARSVPISEGHGPIAGYLPGQGSVVPLIMGNYNITSRDEQEEGFKAYQRMKEEQRERMARDPAYRERVEEEERRREEREADVIGRQLSRL